MSLRILPQNFFDDAAIAVSPAAVATLPETNLQNNTRDVWRSTSTSTQVFTGSWGGNMRVVSAFGVWPSSEGNSSLIGSTWQLELFQDAAMTVSLFNQSYNFFVPTGDSWGTFSWGAQPWGVESSDRIARIVPMVKYFAPVNASAFRITVTDQHYVDTPYLEARRIWLANYVDAPFNAQYGAAPQWKSSSEQWRSVGGSLRRVARARWRELRFDTYVGTEADREAWMDLMYLCDPANEIVASLFPGDPSPRLERDFTVMGSLEALNPIVFATPTVHTLQLAVLES